MRKLLMVATASFSLLFALLAPSASAGVNGWDHVGHGATASVASLDGSVYALYANGTDLYVGGSFTHAGGVPSTFLAMWNGTKWSPFTGLNGAVDAIAFAGGNLYVGGQFTDAGGDGNADFLAMWNGSAWAPFCNASGPAFGGSVSSLQVIGNTLYVGGAIANGAGIAAADYLLACDLTTGAASSTVLNDGDFTGGVYALTTDDSGTLYAGGTFINLTGNLAIDHIGAYDGTWHSMGSGPSTGGGPIDSIVRALASDGNNVYVGTDAVTIGNVAGADHVAKWDGSSWSAMGSSFFSTTTFVYALAVAGPLVFAGGSFQNSSGDPMADEIAYWDGSAWHHLGSDGAGNGPFIGNTTALARLGARVFAGGSFTSAGGDTLARGIAQSPIQQPDAQIRPKGTASFTGRGIYSSAAAGESKTLKVARGKTGTFYLKFQNNGLVSGSFRLHATGSARGFATTYTVAGLGATQKIKAGTYSTAILAPGGSITVKMVVRLTKTSANSASFLIRASEIGAPTDAVKAIVKAK